MIENIKTAVHAARAAGMLIVWFQNGWDDQYVEAGGPGSPNFHKSNALKTMRQRPEPRHAAGERRLDYQLVDELVPEASDIVLPETALQSISSIPRSDSLLRSRGIRHLVFTGIATNVCVESTLRDGFSSSILAWCWKTLPISQPDFAQPPCSISKPLAGSGTSMISKTRWIPLSPVSPEENRYAEIRDYSGHQH